MPRFDNFTNQIDKVNRPKQDDDYIVPTSDTIIVLGANGRQIAATMSQDMTAFMQFMALGSPNTAMTVSTTTNKAALTYMPNKQIYNSGVTVTSGQVGGANAAGFDVMRSDNRFTQSASLIGGATGVNNAIVLAIGSRVVISSVQNAYEIKATETLLKNYYATSGTGAIVGGNSIFMTAMVK